MQTTVRTLVSALLVIAVLTPLGARLAAQSVEADLDRITHRLEAARASQLDLIAPRAFRRAEDKFADARARFERGGRIDEIRRVLRDVETSLNDAARFEEIGRVLLREALAARNAALVANAPEYASEEWKNAQAILIDGGRKVEAGDQNAARERADRAARQYGEAEYQAIRRDLLGKAHESRAQAIKTDAHKKAARTFSTAHSYLQQAEQQLQGDRYAKSEAAKLAKTSADEFRHASLIATIVDEVDRDKRTAVEKLQLEHEAHMARIVEALNFDANFAEGIGPVATQVLDAIRGLYEDRNNLRDDLAVRSRDLALAERRGDSLQTRLRRMVDSLGGQLIMAEQRERRVATELRERERREQTLRRIQQMFSPEQSEVMLSGDELIVHLYGLSFPVGSSEIRPADFSLLTSVQRALRELPNARVTIEGHTDSQGNDEFNQALSQRRADAVRTYLLANMVLDEKRIAAIGFGESRPIANNETAEGRAKNRRIDLRLFLAEKN
jgi:outer membrane protein OmpA-like peptidoglycan-associated protein